MERSPQKILLIDDSPLVLARTRAILIEHGFEVEAASSPIGCSGRILRMKPDVILLDVEMPALGGPEFLAQLRAHASIAHARVLFYSDRPAAELEELAQRSGADGYISKGAPAPELVWRVRQLAAVGGGFVPGVLVADGDESSRLGLALQQRAGYVFAASGRAAIELILGAAPPDLVVCSLKLPDMSGLDVHAMARGADVSWTPRFLMLVEQPGVHPILRQFIEWGGHVTSRGAALAEAAKLIATVGKRSAEASGWALEHRMR